MSMRKVCNTMLVLEYIFITFLKDLLKWLYVRVGAFLTFTNFRPRAMVVNNGAPFTKIKSATRVTNLCHLKIYRDKATKSITTLSGICHTIFSLVSARFGPNLLWYLVISDSVIGQCCIMFYLTMDLKSLSDGWPIITWDPCASLATRVSLLANPLKFLQTVCTKATYWVLLV